MSPAPHHDAGLYRALDAKASEAAGELRRAAAARAAAESLRDNLSLVWILPAIGAAIGCAALLLGHTPGLLAPLWMLALMAIAPLGKAAWDAAWAWRGPVARLDALATFDAAVGARGQLVAAYDFLVRGADGAFERATIEDARRALAAHADQTLTLERRATLIEERHAPHLVAAALLLALHSALFWHFAGAPAPGPTDVAALRPPPEPTPTDPSTPGTAPLPDAPDPTAPPADATTETPPTAGTPRPSEPGAKLPDSMLPSAGETGKGKSSDAQTQSSPSESRGAPSGQSPAPPKENAPQLATKKQQEKKPGAAEPPREPEEESEQSGASAGRGTSKGSNRNTTTSKWTGKDQVTTPDDQEIEDDEDTEDESEEQKNRGGMQPNLRDRRPPASRDLRIGFGNQSSPDANGRGGPSEPKKSRGTASLVLGIPIPDRVKGQPNPGPTRITQERIEPSPEDAPDRPTEARPDRTTDLGPLALPRPPAPTTQLTPWQRQLIRRYLDDRRQPTP